MFQHLGDKPFTSHHSLFERTFPANVEQVWRQALRIGVWMNDHDLETLSGDAGQPGHFERVVPRNIEHRYPPPRYHYYGVAHLVPQKLIVLEVFPEKGGSYGIPKEYIGVDSILLTPLDDRNTRVAVLLSMITPGPAQASSPSVEDEESTTRAQIERYFDNLDALVRMSA
jgi:hypothetical protein